MADASRVAFQFRADALPILDGALEYARQKQIPGGAGRNRLYLEGKVTFKSALPDDLAEILFDPQTSGGLLISVAADRVDALVRELKSRSAAYWIVGKVVEGSGIVIE